MKKLIIAVLLAVFASGTVLAADNGALLTKEEGQFHTFITALISNSGYDAAKDVMSQNLTSRINAKTYSTLQQQIKAKFGTPKNIKLASLEKFDQGDRLVYFATYGNNQLVRIIVVFGPANTNGLQNISFTPVQLAQKGTQKR